MRYQENNSLKDIINKTEFIFVLYIYGKLILQQNDTMIIARVQIVANLKNDIASLK